LQTSSFDQNFEFWRKLRALTKISSFGENFELWPKFRVLTKTSSFDQNFEFWPKFGVLTKISSFEQNFEQKFVFSTRIWIFWQHYFLTEIFIFSQNFYQFFYKIYFVHPKNKITGIIIELFFLILFQNFQSFVFFKKPQKQRFQFYKIKLPTEKILFKIFFLWNKKFLKKMAKFCKIFILFSSSFGQDKNRPELVEMLDFYNADFKEKFEIFEKKIFFWDFQIFKLKIGK